MVDLDPVVAVAISDVHLSLKPPKARRGEPSWLEAMKRPLFAVRELARGGAVLLVAGDLFDRWCAVPELISFALRYLPECYAIPGNHDLPSHRPDLVHRSAFQVLVEAGRVEVLGSDPRVERGTGRALYLYGTPLNADLPKAKRDARDKSALHVCLVHEYLWTGKHGYSQAPREHHLGARGQRYSGFDVVVVGDNHAPFDRTLADGTKVVNCGSLMRRKSDEVDYQPRAALIHASGAVESRTLDLSHDAFVPTPKKVETTPTRGVRRLLEELRRDGCDDLDFRAAVRQALDSEDVERAVAEALLEAMGE